jgi:transmembrane sensor
LRRQENRGTVIGKGFIQNVVMSENQLKLRYLLDRFTNNEITRAEFDELFALVNRDEHEEDIRSVLVEGLANEQLSEKIEQERLDTVLMNILSTDRSEARVRRMIFWKRLTAAAAILLLIGAGIWYGLIRTPKSEVVTKNSKPALIKDIAPGGNKAILTLGDNSTIVLDDAANGQLAQEGSSRVNKTKDGELRYQSATGKSESALTYNTLRTPRGGQYQLVLPDGSKVWLNAASSIRFPTAFTGDERKVEMTGEVYFEVAKNPNKPFKVHFSSNGGGREGAVEVLGTHFNINAYDDEDAIKTTLLEGSVKVVNRQSANSNEQSAILKPGQQAVIAANSPLTTHHSPDLESIMAWKNGLFHFENVDIKTVMRQISRWYDIEVEYKGAVKNEPLFIEVPRNTNLSDVLKVLETTAGLQLRIEGKKVTVL